MEKPMIKPNEFVSNSKTQALWYKSRWEHVRMKIKLF